MHSVAVLTKHSVWLLYLLFVLYTATLYGRGVVLIPQGFFCIIKTHTIVWILPLPNTIQSSKIFSRQNVLRRRKSNLKIIRIHFLRNDYNSSIKTILYNTGFQTRFGIDGTIFSRLSTNDDPYGLPDLQLTFIARAAENENIKCAIQRMNNRVCIIFKLHIRV